MDNYRLRRSPNQVTATHSHVTTNEACLRFDALAISTMNTFPIECHVYGSGHSPINSDISSAEQENTSRKLTCITLSLICNVMRTANGTRRQAFDATIFNLILVGSNLVDSNLARSTWSTTDLL